MNNCLAAQGSAWRVTGNFPLAGNVRLDRYEAWVESSPQVNQGTLPQYDGFAAAGKGGAVLGIHYLPSGADPASPHWLQLIHTNYPGGGAAWTLPYDQPGFVWYIDNRGGANPFYDVAAPYAANGSDFFDTPFRPYRDNSQWNGYLFLATGDEVAQTANVSGVVYWGFHDPVVAVPEPGPLMLTLIGGLLPPIAWLRRRVRPVIQDAAPIESRLAAREIR